MPNRLAGEKSPYLRQHANNPVDWHPWGTEAFDRARQEDKPVFLSVGYSTCHWCHVMAHECFEDADIAAQLNRDFVCVKVDREERPDLDHVYMTFVQAVSGSGGWPMSVWLTPDRTPFYGGTYFPPHDNYGRPGFPRLLREILRAWRERREEIERQAADITAQLRTMGRERGAGEAPSVKICESALHSLRREFDAAEGGFGGGPKFPMAPTLAFLLSCAGPEAREMALHSLRKMAAGGIHDHLGGGFHRYAVDRAWRIPHYEKMLIDQALLAPLYLQAARRSGDEFFADTARGILRYVQDRMTAPGGGFYSAEDADSLPHPAADHPREGAYYLWTLREVQDLLGEDAPLFARVYGLRPDGNAPPEADPQGELSGFNTLRLAENPGQDPDTLAQLARGRQGLLAARAGRCPPHRDEKILTAWNGLMISAFSRAGEITPARRAADFLRRALYDENRGVLRRVYLDGPADLDGFADDYAFLIQGLLDLHEAGGDAGWLRWAEELQDRQDELFFDHEAGGYFSAGATDPLLLFRDKDAHDGSAPSVNAVSAHNLLRIAVMKGDEARRLRAESIFRAFAGSLKAAPASAPLLVSALEFFHARDVQRVVISGDPQSSLCRIFLEKLRAFPHPRRVVLWDAPAASPAVMLCREPHCELPITDPAILSARLRTFC